MVTNKRHDARSLDALVVSIGFVSDTTRDISNYRGWHFDGGLPPAVTDHCRAMVSAAAGAVETCSRKVSVMARMKEADALVNARLLAANASFVATWPSLSFSGRSSEAVLNLAARTFVGLFHGMGLVESQSEALARLVRVDLVCGKAGAYIRHIDALGERACGSAEAWTSLVDASAEPETMRIISALAAARGVDDATAARGFASDMVDAVSMWDLWQTRCFGSLRAFDYETPFGDAVEHGAYGGWCGLFDVSPVACTLPLPSGFLAKASSTYDVVTVSRRNAGKTWAEYR